MRNPLVGPAVCFAAGIVVSTLARFTAAEGLVWLAVFVVAWIVGKGWLRGVGMGGAMMAAGVLTWLWHEPAAAPQLEAKEREWTGCVAEGSTVKDGRLRFLLELAPGQRARVSIAPAKGGTGWKELSYGTRVKVRARMRRMRGYLNPGTFGMEEYAARRGIYWTAAGVRGVAPEVLGGGCGEAWRGWLERARVRALAGIDALYPGDGYHAAMMRGLLLGDKTGIKRVWTDEFRRTGTYHALVISGSHVTLVCGVFLWWRRYMGYGSRTVLGVAVGVAWVYSMLAGGDAPVMRAAVGFSFYALASLLFRRTSVLNLLGGITLAFLAFDPQQLFEASFQLSFLAVAAIGAFAQGHEGRLEWQRRKMARALELRLLAETASLCFGVKVQGVRRALGVAARVWMAAWSLFKTSAAVQAGLALPMALYFHRVSLSGLTANVLVVPVLSQAIPVGFAAVFSGSEWMAGAAAWLLDVSRAIAVWHVRWEPAWRIPDPPLWLSVGLAASLVVCAWMRGRRGFWAAAAASGVLLVLLVWHPFETRSKAGLMELAALDVGMGESLYVGLPDGGRMMIDGGGVPQRGREEGDLFDVGEEVVSPYLWARGVGRLDVVVMTHLHDDHAGGIAALMENFRPRELWVGFAPEEYKLWRKLEGRARALGIEVKRWKQGERRSYGGVEWEALAPLAGQRWRGKPRNDDSLVLRARHGKCVFLMTGDTERQIEVRWLEEGLMGRVDVLKVAHHGSRYSTLPVLLEALKPAVALISAGEGNSFGLPHEETVARLRAGHAVVLRTDERGLVSALSDGARVWPGAQGRGAAERTGWDLF